MNKDYSEYQDADRHANNRDKKHAKKVEQRLMRGNRSVFEIEKSIQKRGKEKRRGEGPI